MTIRKLGYELYRIDWAQRISTERKQDALKNYYQDVDEVDKKEYPFYMYLGDVGYNGEVYVCYEEFLEIEYLDKGYMKQLFNNDELFEEYQKDLIK